MVEFDKETVNVLNSAFYLYEAADILVREFERRLPALKVGLQFSTKQKMNNIASTVKRLEFLVESFLDEYNNSYDQTELGSMTENIRKIASYYARFALILGDRCEKGDGTKEQMIMDYAENMPPQGYVEQRTIDRLTL